MTVHMIEIAQAGPEVSTEDLHYLSVTLIRRECHPAVSKHFEYIFRGSLKGFGCQFNEAVG
jgi:hypothetical protein